MPTQGITVPLQGRQTQLCMEAQRLTGLSCGLLGSHASLKGIPGASLVAQWLRIRLPMHGTRVRALVREAPTCRGATGPVSHNY